MNKINLDDKAQLKILGDSMEEQIGQAVRESAPKNLADISRLSADAILTQYQAMAASIEEMGQDATLKITDLEKEIGAIETATRDQIFRIEELIAAEVSEAARVTRENGKKAQALVEEVGRISADIRESCIDFKRRVGG